MLKPDFRVARCVCSADRRAVSVLPGSVVVDPANVQKNQLVTLKADGILNKPTTSGTYQLSVNLGGADIYSHSGSICGNEAVRGPVQVVVRRTRSTASVCALVYFGLSPDVTLPCPAVYLQVSLPLNVGVINLRGFECPANPGPVSYGLDVKLPTIAPSGNYKISITAVDQDGVNLMCIETDLSL